jgi:hypothetical protein
MALVPLILNFSFPHIPRCVIHRIHLVVLFGLGDSSVRKIVVDEGDEEVLEEAVVGPQGYAIPVVLKELVAKFRAVCRTIKARSLMVEFVKREDLVQQAAGINVHKLRLPRSIKTDMPVRWTSTEAMFKRVLLLRTPVMRLQLEEAHRKVFDASQILTQGDFEVLAAVVDVLEPFGQAITLLSSSSKPTFGLSIYFEFRLAYLVEEALHPLHPRLPPTGAVLTVRSLP